LTGLQYRIVKRPLLILGLAAGIGPAGVAHDVITTRITWDREITRLVYSRCASCHREGGSAFSLMTYADGRPWAVAMKEEVLARRMPPWGAIKGFGDFRNDQALTPEQMEIIVSWVDGGVPEGEEKDLPPPPKFTPDPPVVPVKGEVAVSGDYTLGRALTLDGLFPKTVPDDSSFQVTAELPDGGVEPLLWLSHYKTKFGHAFLLRTPLDLPKGTIIRGVPKGATVVLLPVAAEPATAVLSPGRQSGQYSRRPSAGIAPKRDTSAHAGTLK
jgi:hypothetical protein